MKDIQVDELPTPKRKYTKYLCALIAMISIIISVIFGILYFKINSNFNDQRPFSPLPSSFLVNSSYLTPTKNQYSRGTCWIFQIISLLESFYRHQGIKQGYLLDDEYLSLSAEALGQTLIKMCQKYPNYLVCQNSYRKLNLTSHGSPEEFYDFYSTFPDVRTSVLPEGSCPYQDIEDETKIKCQNMEDDVKNNPLKFKMHAKKVVSDIETIKRLIYDLKNPLAFSISNPVTRYWFECDNPIVKDDPICVHKLIQCPSISGAFCGPVEYHLYKPLSTEIVFHHSSKDTTIGVNHAIVLVGYNDNYIESLPVNITRDRPLLKGGLILKNSWGSVGHSLEYLMSRITKEQEAAICPNSDDPFGWVPASFDCIQKVKEPSKCNVDTQRQFGKKTIRGATELVCVNETHCNPNKRYVLLANPLTNEPLITFSNNDVPFPNVIEFSSIENSAEVKVLRTIPFEHLYYALRRGDGAQSNDMKHCGYYMFQYETIRHMMRNSGPEMAHLRAVQIEVEWTKESYINSGAKKNYTRVKQSMGHYSILDSKDPARFLFDSEL